MNWIPISRDGSGLENITLDERLKGIDSIWPELANCLEEKQKIELNSQSVKRAVQALIHGDFGLPWIQAIVNSAIDADKIDYLGFDQELLEDRGYPVNLRIRLGPPRPPVGVSASIPWLDEFLCDQRINHVGLLCLSGRSAVAAADLIRERVLFYDRFYLAPEIRVPERIAFEILQHFLIRSTMSLPFHRSIDEQYRSEKALADRARDRDWSGNVIREKCTAVRDQILKLVEKGKGEDREFKILEYAFQMVRDCERIDRKYLEFLERSFQMVNELKNDKSVSALKQLADESIVRQPIVIRRGKYLDALEIIRPLQHEYCRDALIDLVKLPSALSAPRWGRFETESGRTEDVYAGILVPKGPVSTWGPGSRASVPLSSKAVSELERPYARICVISPGNARSAKALYIWDRVRSTLLREDINILEEGNDDAKRDKNLRHSIPNS
jgi:hypothetical protein